MCLYPKRIGTAISTRQNQLSFISRLPKTSCGQIACWILARTSSLVNGLCMKYVDVVWSCLPFIRSGQNHLARLSERGKKTRRTKEEVGRQHQGMDRPGVRQVPEGSGERTQMEETGCEILCGAPTTFAVKVLMMMMMTMMMIMRKLPAFSPVHRQKEGDL